MLLLVQAVTFDGWFFYDHKMCQRWSSSISLTVFVPFGLWVTNVKRLSTRVASLLVYNVHHLSRYQAEFCKIGWEECRSYITMNKVLCCVVLCSPCCCCFINVLFIHVFIEYEYHSFFLFLFIFQIIYLPLTNVNIVCSKRFLLDNFLFINNRIFFFI